MFKFSKNWNWLENKYGAFFSFKYGAHNCESSFFQKLPFFQDTGPSMHEIDK